MERENINDEFENTENAILKKIASKNKFSTDTFDKIYGKPKIDR